MRMQQNIQCQYCSDMYTKKIKKEIYSVTSNFDNESVTPTKNREEQFTEFWRLSCHFKCLWYAYLHCLEWYSFKAAFQRCLILFKSYIVYHCMDILYLISLSCLVFNLHLMGLLWKVVVAAIFKNLFHWSIFDL